MFYTSVICTLAYYRPEWFSCIDMFLIALDIIIFHYLNNLQVKWLTFYGNYILWNISEVWCSKHNHPTDKKWCAMPSIPYSPFRLSTTLFTLLHQWLMCSSQRSFLPPDFKLVKGGHQEDSGEWERGMVPVPLADFLQDHSLQNGCVPLPKTKTISWYSSTGILVGDHNHTLQAPFRPPSSNFCPLFWGLECFTTISIKPV